MSRQFLLDGRPVPFADGQTILEAARAAGHYIPHLCWHPDFPPHGSCKLCIVKVAGRHVSSCAMPAREGMEVESNTPEINAERRALVQMLFVEGNHFCPSCEKSGNCQLQALAYELDMASARFNHFFPDRPVDASHPDVLLDFNRCIFCELCVRASRDIDGKSVFALTGRGIRKHLAVNAESGRLADTDFAATDRAADICPVGVILKKRVGFAVPIGSRKYDTKPISKVAMEEGE
jgi:[NiFe] hydrogenase diaphorase moiety small subunit